MPGTVGGIKSLHGQAHGRGIYSASLQNPSLSIGFCHGGGGPLPTPLLQCSHTTLLPYYNRFSAPNEVVVYDNYRLLICGVIKDWATLYDPTYSADSSTPNVVKQVGDAIIVDSEARIAPLFIASVGTYSPAYQRYLPQDVLDFLRVQSEGKAAIKTQLKIVEARFALQRAALDYQLAEYARCKNDIAAFLETKRVDIERRVALLASEAERQSRREAIMHQKNTRKVKQMQNHLERSKERWAKYFSTG